MNKCICFAILLCIIQTGWAAADLYEQAQQRRQHAEEQLAQQRALILKERQALLDEFAVLQQRLSALKQTANKSHEQLQRLQDHVALRDQAADEAADRLALTINRVSSALGIAAPTQTDAAHCASTWQHAINAQLKELEQDARLQIKAMDIAGRNGEAIAAKVIACGAVQQLAVSADARNSGFVIRAADAYVVNGPLLDGVTFKRLQELDAEQGGFILADIEGSLKTHELQIESWTTWLEKGGFFVWPIIAVGFIAFILASERIVHVLRLRIQPQFLTEIMTKLHNDAFEEAAAAVAARSNPLQRVLCCGLEVIDKEQAIRESALEASLLAEEADLDRSRSLLAVLAAVAPLLGLLGTVTGMISTFQGIALYGTANPALLSNGISEALITTQLGLVVAVPILLVHGFINRIAEKRRIILEQAAGHVLSVQTS